jgi:hypothetical protein
MKLNSLKSLDSIKRLKPLDSITPKEKVNINPLNEIDIILYSTNLCYYATRILRNEIKVNNGEIKVNIISKELLKLNRLLSKRDFLLQSNYTKKDTREFYKKIGLKQKYIN